MNKIKKAISVTAGLAMLLCGCSGSGTAASSSSEVLTGTGKGNGGDITVTLTRENGKITKAEIKGDDETPDIGQKAFSTLSDEIVSANACDVDAVSGATRTSDGVISACNAALNGGSSAAASTASEEKGTLTDGEYTASAWGFGLTAPLPVTVRVKNGRIADITTGDNNSETASILKNAKDLLIPRIIEAQSVGVDSITGATETSGAIKAAVLDAVEQAGGDRTVYSAVVADTPGEDRTYDADVVVVGFGGSGATAALAAQQAGANVIALEKAGKTGGTSAVTGGPMSINEPSQVAKEIKDWTNPATGEVEDKPAGQELVDADELYQDWVDYTTVDGEVGSKPEIIKELLDNSGQTSAWMIDNGFAFTDAIGFLGNKYAIYTPYVGNKAQTEAMWNTFEGNFEKLGGKVLHETTVESINTDSDGKITGVSAVMDDGTKVTVNAGQVILATGGFGGSADMMNEYLGEDWKLYGMAQNTGDGIRMATELGAATYNIDMPPMSHFSAPTVITNDYDSPFDNDIPYAMVSTSETLALNKKGERFLNEERIQYTAYVGGSRYFSIYSSDMIDMLREKGFAKDASGRYLNHFGVGGVPTKDVPMTDIDTVLNDAIAKGFVYKADSLQALGEAIKADYPEMDVDTFLASIKTYNEGVANKDDALGKSEESYERLGQIEDGNDYYIAVTGAPYIYSTCGGLDVDEEFHVLNTDGDPIEGLYAVGTDSMGVLFTNKKGYANYGGVAQGYCFTSGRLAGENAAAAAKN